jgi:hypothetical protein
MRNIVLPILTVALYGCSSYPIEKGTASTVHLCLGISDLRASLANKFQPIQDEQLLGEALGKAERDKLCQGQVYKSKADSQIVLFRAWNSTNPNGKFGKWWTFQRPTGRISTYRSDYEVCYQWSPLDKLVRCTPKPDMKLKPDMKIVVGTGQSAECLEYLTYLVSDKQQIYIGDASTSVTSCSVYDGEFSWK